MDSRGGTTRSRAAAPGRTYRGRRLFLADRDDEALSELNRALSLDPLNHRAWAYRGDVHSWNGRTDQAIADLTAALDLDPTLAWAFAERGVAHREAGRFDHAVGEVGDGMLGAVESIASVPGRDARGGCNSVLNLFRVMLLEPDRSMAAATEAFLATSPDHDSVADLLHYLAELTVVNGALADRARRCE